jgi:hypothetical protein
MKNKQPFYHRAVILFTATQEISTEELKRILKRKLGTDGIITTSVEVEECDSEPGDPADLM